MRRLDQPAQPVVLNMGIDLCRRDVRMPQHLLHAAQIGTMGEEMRREGVAQHMGRQQRRIKPRLQRQILQQLAAAVPGDVAFLRGR